MVTEAVGSMAVEGSKDTFDQMGGWPGVLGRLFARQDLTAGEAAATIDQIFEGEGSPAQIAAFAAALRVKGETVEEMTGLVGAMLARSEPLEMEGDLLDTCGTGGDRSGSINVSTISALVVAGAGGRVCKHGNRAASSQAGSADVLEALGVVIDLGPGGVRRCIEEVGMGFCFAPRFHPAMRHAIPVRRELGVPTVFNFLGPLANPARVRHQVVGVSDPDMAHKMLGVLIANGCKTAMVIHGSDGLDELSTAGPSKVHELVSDGTVVKRVIDAEELGFARAGLQDIRGGDAARNAEAVRQVLSGARGAYRDISVLNSAAGLVVAGLVPDMPAGVELATAVIDDGSAANVLEGLVRVSRDAARS
jgi:anthranilate phosphoribosyltransferase